MKTSNKYSGKKLRRPEIEKPFVKINRELITCKDLSDFEFRLLCFLFSYSNGTTITTLNLSEKLHKSERRILEVLSRLASIEVLKFTETQIELFISPDKINCEIPQCEISHIEENDCEVSHTELRDSSSLTAGNDMINSENSQTNTLETIDIIDVKENYNIINNKNSIDKNILGNNIVCSGKDSSEFNSENQSDLFETEEKYIPIIGKDFNPKEELEIVISQKDGSSSWKLKQEPKSGFINKKYTYKLTDLYNQWISLNIIEHSKFSFKTFEFAVIYMILSMDSGKRIQNNYDLNKHLQIYPISNLINNVNWFFNELLEDSQSVIIPDESEPLIPE